MSKCYHSSTTDDLRNDALGLTGKVIQAFAAGPTIWQIIRENGVHDVAQVPEVRNEA